MPSHERTLRHVAGPSYECSRRCKLNVTLSLANRLTCLLLALACLALLITAAGLTPSPKGFATHTQLGLPACGWMVSLGKPCMTCGMTTAFANAAEARFPQSIIAQPMGFVLAVLCAATLVGCLHAAITGWRIDRLLTSLVRPKVLWCFLAVFLAAWGYKWMVV